jgi:pimeloyl-ACP methyl ester carboxylesterase
MAHKAGIAGAAVGALGASMLGVAKAVAVNDRRRTKVSKQQAKVAAALADPSDAIHRTLTLSDGATYHVVERQPSGVPSEPPVVLLHGVTLSTRIWHHALDELGSSCRAVAIDWRGHGRSVAGADGFGLDILARDLAEVVTQLDLRSCVIVGHSMGGMALMRFAADHPAVLHERVGGLLFLSTACADVGVGALPNVVRAGVRRMMSLSPIARRASWTLPGDLGYTMVRLTFGDRPTPLGVELARDIVANMDPDATAASIVPLLGHDARASLPRVTLPTMVMVGSEDRVTPPAQARKIASLISGAELIELDGPGHMIMLERPARLHQAIRKLSRSVSRQSVAR